MRGLSFPNDGKTTGFSPYVDCGKPVLDTNYLKVSMKVKINSLPQELRGALVSRRNSSGWNITIVGTASVSADWGKIAVFESGSSSVMSNTVLQVGKVYDINIVFQGTTVSIYINGILDKTGTLTWTNDNNNKVMLGAFHTDSTHQYRIDQTIYSLKIHSSAGLQLYYAFINAIGNHVVDLSGNNNNGELFSGPKWIISSTGKGFDFNGVSDYIEFGKQLVPYNSPFRIKAKFSTRSTPQSGAYHGIWSEDYDSSNKRISLAVDSTNRIVINQYKNPGGVGFVATTTNPCIVEDKIHEVEYVSNGTTGYLLVDGVNISVYGTGTTNGLIDSHASDPANMNNSPTFRIGRYRSSFLDGQIYSVKVSSPSGAILDLDMTNANGKTIYDLSSSGNNGTIAGTGSKAYQLTKSIPDIVAKNILPTFDSASWSINASAVVLNNRELALISPNASWRSTSVSNISVRVGEKYEFGCDTSGGNTGKMWIHFYSGSTFTGQQASTSGTPTIVTVPSGFGIDNIKVHLDNNTTIGGYFKFKDPYLVLVPSRTTNDNKKVTKVNGKNKLPYSKTTGSGKNLLDTRNPEVGKWYNITIGTNPLTNSDWDAYSIQVTPSTSYAFSNVNNVHITFFDSNGALIQTGTSPARWGFQATNSAITTPANAVLMRVSIQKSANARPEKVQVEKGSVVTAYEPFKSISVAKRLGD